MSSAIEEAQIQTELPIQICFEEERNQISRWSLECVHYGKVIVLALKNEFSSPLSKTAGTMMYNKSFEVKCGV